MYLFDLYQHSFIVLFSIMARSFVIIKFIESITSIYSSCNCSKLEKLKKVLRAKKLVP